MGFFDVLKKAASTVISGVSGLVSHSPALQAIAPLAGIVAHAIPAVGPVIDAAVPALNAVFSNDTSSPPIDPAATAPVASGQPASPDPSSGSISDKKIIDNFHILEDNLTDKMKSFLNNFTKASTEAKDALQTKFDQLNDTVKSTVNNALKHQVYLDGHACLENSIAYFDSHCKELAQLTANSHEADFETLLNAAGGNLKTYRQDIQKWIHKAGGQLGDKSWAPSKEMLDLYMALIHWLLIFHKAIIVTTGLQARGLFVNKQYDKYFTSLTYVFNETDELRQAANDSRKFLLQMVQDLNSRRPGFIQIKDRLEADGTTVYSMTDNWPMLSVGWIPRDKLSEVAADLGSEMTITAPKEANDAQKKEQHDKLQASPQMVLYKETVTRCLQENLRPYEAVVEDLETYLKNWANRMPIGPEAPKAGKQVAQVTAEPKTTSGNPHTAERFVNRKLRYCVSYVSSNGESKPSDWSEPVDITNKHAEVELSFPEFKFEGDPFAGTQRVANGDSGEKPTYNRGYRKRVYVRYPTNPKEHNGGMSVELVKDFDEFEEKATHDLRETSDNPEQEIASSGNKGEDDSPKKEVTSSSKKGEDDSPKQEVTSASKKGEDDSPKGEVAPSKKKVEDGSPKGEAVSSEKKVENNP